MDYKKFIVSSLMSSSSDSEDELELLNILGIQKEIPKIKNFVENVVSNFSDKEVSNMMTLCILKFKWIYAFSSSKILGYHETPLTG